MPLNLHDPTIVRWPDNPATMIARNGIESLDLGFTEPLLNNGRMIQNKRLAGGLPPIVFPVPTVNIAQTILQSGLQGWEATVTPPTNSIDWQIMLPPDPLDAGVWTSAVEASSLQVSQIIQKLANVHAAFPVEWGWKIVVHPLPNAAAFMQHVYLHELQHVEDHSWLARQIIGPWDDWLTTANQKGLRFQGGGKYQMIADLTLPGNYATTVDRIARYWQDTITKSGDLFHKTPNGAPPKIKVLKIAGTPRLNWGKMELHLSIEPQTLLTTLPTGPHQMFALKKLSAPINGNDPPLRGGISGPRMLNIYNVHGVAAASIIGI